MIADGDAPPVPSLARSIGIALLWSLILLAGIGLLWAFTHGAI